jgi:excisionase family DNA binding protein
MVSNGIKQLPADNEKVNKMANKTDEFGPVALVKIKPAARELNISPARLYNAIADEDVHAVRLGRGLRIPRTELDRIIAEGF